MHAAITEQLDKIRKGMLGYACSSDEIDLVENMTDDELLVLLFKHVKVAEGLEGYLLSQLLIGNGEN